MHQVYEYVGNLHMHTPYSDGEAYHGEIARAALRAGLDFVIVTDHNVHVRGVEGYYGPSPQRRVLLLVGEEVHDVRRDPQRNHLLVYGVEPELAPYAPDPQELVNQVGENLGSCYIAHPNDPAAPLFGEEALTWDAWDVEGCTGLELWNFMSEFKLYLTSKPNAIRAAFAPDRYICGPQPETLALWDQLLAEGKQVKVVGGADAHGATYHMGPLRRVIFPYEYLFRCVNTHVLTSRPLNGDSDTDKLSVLRALRNGHAFVGYDLPHPTGGFRFSAQGQDDRVIMGGRIRIGHGVTLQTVIPTIAETRLLKDGKIILHEFDGTHYTHIARETGVYRVEVYIRYKGKRRGWIFSNPIFVVD